MSKKTKTLYHYTTKEGQQGILETGVIRQSTESESYDDAAFGDGVYLTSRPPSDGKIGLAINNYDGSDPRQALNQGRLERYIKVELDADDVEKVKDDKDKRNIYLYPGDLHLDEARRVSTGKVVKY